MTLIVCLDDRLGMAFNRRRQSRDRTLIVDMVRVVGRAKLWIMPYSAPLFEGHCLDLSVSDDPMRDAREGEYCFLETQAPEITEKLPDRLMIYRWNRHYPSDVVFNADLLAFRLVSAEEFVGSSHEKITKEVWER